MSSILHRPDSRKTSICPDASMLRKLVRDRNCRPVLRGILESLLHYLTQDLPRWTTSNGDPEGPGSDIVVERNTYWPDQRVEHLQASCTVVHLPEERKPTMGKIAEVAHIIPEKDPQKDRYGGEQKAGGLIQRRLTTFQLLQSKFIRSTPKPPITHQREVGPLASSRGVAGTVNHCQDSETSKQRRDETEIKITIHNIKGVKQVYGMR